MPEVNKNLRVLPVLRAYTKATLRYPGKLSVVVIAVFVAQIASLLVPLYLKQFINTISSGIPSELIIHSLFTILFIYAGIGIVNLLARLTQSVFVSNLEAEVMADLSNNAFANLIKHSHDFFISNFSGSLTRRVTRYSRSFEQIMDSVMFNFLPTLIFSIGSIAVLYQRNHWLGIALFVWVVVFITLQIILTAWRYPCESQVQPLTPK